MKQPTPYMQWVMKVVTGGARQIRVKPSDNGRKVYRSGAQRSAVFMDRKSDAEHKARAIAKSENLDLIVQGKNGAIVKKSF
ncbi:MAG TPA: DUF2188 domain-containing protein [Candidatus Absconditabacterales bacterium]|nr:DUF2188 domain-containing protein [Candidatus Absconditabacterales bacterium]HMT26970.1 DUF2188 domain-containing protein [Candidatus Absconditabacterales bacterium]